MNTKFQFFRCFLWFASVSLIEAVSAEDVHKRTFRNQVGMEFVRVSFFDNVMPPRPGFYCQTTEVTVGQFDQFVQSTGYKPELWTIDNMDYRDWRRDHAVDIEQFPVVFVTFKDALEFCRWLSAKDHRRYSLPTVSEWVWSCTCGETSSGPVERLRYSKCGVGRPNVWGLHDMLGNVREVCDEWGLPNSDQVSPSQVLDGLPIAARGGSWRSDSRFDDARFYDWVEAKSGNSETGFRVIIRD